MEAEESNPQSTLHLVREVTRLRARLLDDGVFDAAASAVWTAGPDGLVMCRRNDGAVVAIAMGESPVALPSGRQVVLSEPLVDGLLPPDAAAWIVPEA